MAAEHAKLNRTWTVAEAKARLSEILRLAEEEGPQHIGTRRETPSSSCPNAVWHANNRRHVNRWASGWSRTCRVG